MYVKKRLNNDCFVRVSFNVNVVNSKVINAKSH
jgi:hypothetical protein